MANKRKDSADKNYQIGYGKPPAHTRFKKGESGNANGRPKGTLNFATVLLKTLREMVVVNENGRRTTITKLEAAVKQLVNKAAGGDLRALSQLFTLARVAEESGAEAMAPGEVLNELDHKVMLGILKRYQQALKKGEHE